MLKTVDEIQAQITPSLQKLLNDILLESDERRPLMFGDELEFKSIKGKTFSIEMNACFIPCKDRFIIFLKHIDQIGNKEEYDIAHELGHLWLLLLGLPPEKTTTDRNRQESYDTFFSPLREFMEHAVFYPLIKSKYHIDLYKIGNARLASFIRSQLPKLKNESEPEKLLLMLNYIKYKVEANDYYWLERLHKAYSKKALDVKNVADSLLPIVQKLASTKDAQFFISQYRKVLKIIGTHFHIPEELWPNFATQTNSRMVG
jgi:hypothetical protein